MDKKEAIAYSPTVNLVRQVLAKHLNEYKNALLVDLADLLSFSIQEERERRDRIIIKWFSSLSLEKNQSIGENVSELLLALSNNKEDKV